MTEAEAGAAGLFHALAQPAEAWTLRPPIPMDAEGMHASRLAFVGRRVAFYII